MCHWGTKNLFVHLEAYFCQRVCSEGRTQTESRSVTDTHTGNSSQAC